MPIAGHIRDVYTDTVYTSRSERGVGRGDSPGRKPGGATKMGVIRGYEASNYFWGRKIEVPQSPITHSTLLQVRHLHSDW